MRRDSASARRAGVLLGVFLSAAASAAAATPPPPPAPVPDEAAIYQYRESLPASGGSVVPDRPAAPQQPLPGAIVERLERTGGPDAAVLERVATSPALGAPIVRRRHATPVAASAEPAAVDESSAGDAVGAAAGAVGGHTRLVALLLGALVFSVGTLVTARRHGATG